MRNAEGPISAEPGAPPRYAVFPNQISSATILPAHHLARETFIDPDVLDESINHAVDALNSERKRNPLGNQRISA